MDRQAKISELKTIMQDYLKAKDYDLVEFIYRYEGRDLILRILADRPQGGITIEECADLNKELSNILDENDTLQERYILEVSSPGLDRPLFTKNDFMRCINKKVHLFFNEQVNQKSELEARIVEVGEEVVKVDIDGNISEIPIAKIRKAKQVI